MGESRGQRMAFLCVLGSEVLKDSTPVPVVLYT